MKHINDKTPNFYDSDGKFFLVRCFNCEPERGTENWAPAVATGKCAFCGWLIDKEQKNDGEGR